MDEIKELVGKSHIQMIPYRSGGFINKDYNMGRVCIDLPLLEARDLVDKLTKEWS